MKKIIIAVGAALILSSPALARDVTDPACLKWETRAILDALVARFGPVKIVSTCRPGALIRGTRHQSYHAKNQAVDFIAPPGRKRAVVRWLRDRGDVLVMTYATMAHVHFNTGQVGFAFGRGRPGRRLALSARKAPGSRAEGLGASLLSR